MRRLHYPYRTEQTYVGWALRFLSFLKNEAADGIGTRHVAEFLDRVVMLPQSIEQPLRRQIESVKTTQIYTPVMQKPGLGVRSPLND